MSILRGITRDLVDKRLWPVAALLGVGIVAALVVALSASGAEPQPDGATGAAGASPANGAVTTAPPSELNAERGLLGAANDPFRRNLTPDGAQSVPSTAQPPPVAPSAGAATVDPPAGSGGGASGGEVTLALSPGAGSGGGGEATAPQTGPVQVPEPAARPQSGDDDEDDEPEESFALWEVDVRVFRGDQQVRGISDIAPLTPLPTAKRPAALYFGVFNGGSSAGFVINRTVTVEGSNCEKRAPLDCSLLRLRPGRDATISFEQDGETVSYRIVVVDIDKVITSDERRAREHRERQSRIGGCLLKTMGQDYGAVLFDYDQGTWSAGGNLEECLEG